MIDQHLHRPQKSFDQSFIQSSQSLMPSMHLNRKLPHTIWMVTGMYLVIHPINSNRNKITQSNLQNNDTLNQHHDLHIINNSSYVSQSRTCLQYSHTFRHEIKL